jgi:hypothetical protein
MTEVRGKRSLIVCSIHGHVSVVDRALVRNGEMHAVKQDLKQTAL